jgi:fermentation-respiration switch protein FrsA (DUF1100 family)
MVLWLWSTIGLCLLVVFAVSLYASLEITKIPYLAVPYTPKDFGWTFEDVSFVSHDGLRLTGWFVAARSPSPVTIILQHGVGSNAGDLLENTACLEREGRWNLLYYNFRGHADSQGTRTSLGPWEVEDLRSAIRFLKSVKPEASRRLGIYGFSLGAAVAIVGAGRYGELEAVVAECPFSRISRTVRHFARIFYGIPNWPFMSIAVALASLRLGLRLGDFSPVREIGRIAPRPLFLIHSGRDLRMPSQEARDLWQAAREPKEQWIVPDADHGEAWLVAKGEYERRLVSFFRKAFQ